MTNPFEGNSTFKIRELNLKVEFKTSPYKGFYRKNLH